MMNTRTLVPQMAGWNPDMGLKGQAHVYPWHSGSIKYLKEVGLWSDKLEKDQLGLLEREKKLSELWKTVISEATNQGVKGKDFAKFCLKKRAEAFPDYYQPVE